MRHPSVGFADSSPCRGAFQTAVSQKPPLQGEVDAPQGAAGGVHCRFAAEVSCKAGQSLAPCFVRDDACIVPESLRRRKAPRWAKTPAPHCGRERVAIHKRQPPSRAGRRADEIIGPYAGGAALHNRHPPYLPSRFRRPFALHCRAGVHARRKSLRRPGRILARPGAAPLSRLTPTAPLTGEPFERQVPQSLPCKGRWVRRKAQPEGCIAALRRWWPAKPGETMPYVS